MASTTMDKPIHSLVIDAGPIIKNDPSVSTLLAKSQILYTIPSVIEEIRDAPTRSRVETTLLPFLTLRSPKPASVKFIQDFARKTGDLEVLSKPDIQLMALTYELECERNGGDWRLRNTPGQKRINGAPPSKEVGGETEVKEDGVEKAEVKEEEGPISEPEPIKARPGAWGQMIPETQVISQIPTKPQEPIESPTDLLAATTISDPEPPQEPISQEAEEPLDPGMTEEFEAESEESDEEGGGWITPSNLHKHVAKENNPSSSQPSKSKIPQTLQVALLTSDYAMQNVLLRIGLNLLSPALTRITTLKTWILRCHGCFSTTKLMDKQFCPKCGQPTLLRTSCQVDGATGNVKIFLKRNMQWSHRGDRYSIPKPVAGSTNGRRSEGGGKGGWGRELVLAEDQKEYVGMMVERKRGEKKERELWDEDYLPGILSGQRRGPGGKIKVGAGRNVNSKKRNK